MRPRVALLILCAALSAFVGWAFAPASYDDGYITYRYADNFARGRGFVFNPGEAVLGTSAPGYGIALGILARPLRPLGVGVDHVAAVLFLAGLALLPLSLARSIRALEGRHPEVVAGLFAWLAIPARWNLELMGCEQVPMLALIALAFALALEGQQVAAGVCAGVAGAFRFDGGLAVAALLVTLWIDRRRVPWQLGLAAMLPVVCCWSWLLATFGTILPITLAGKRSEMEFVSVSYGAAEFDWFRRCFGAAGTGALAALALIGLISLVRSRGRARLFTFGIAGWLMAHELFYRWSGAPFAPWYHVAVVNALLALGALGALEILPRTKSSSHSPPPDRRSAFARIALLGACLGAMLLGASDVFLTSWGRPPDPRIRIYLDVARELDRISPPGARVAAVEVGALAFFADRPVVDLAGLLEPTMRNARQTQRLSAELAAAAPEFLVDNPAFHGNFLKQPVDAGDLERRYREVAAFSRPEYPYRVRLLERVPASLP